MRKNDPTEATLVFVVLLLLIYVLSGFRPAIYTALTAGLLGLFLKPVAKALQHFLAVFNMVMGKIMGYVLFITIFYFLLTPLAILSKLFTRKGALRLKNDCDSFFQDRANEIRNDFFEKPW